MIAFVRIAKLLSVLCSLLALSAGLNAEDLSCPLNSSFPIFQTPNQSRLAVLIAQGCTIWGPNDCGEMFELVDTIGIDELILEKRKYIEILGPNQFLKALTYFRGRTVPIDALLGAIQLCFSSGASMAETSLDPFITSPEAFELLRRNGAECLKENEHEDRQEREGHDEDEDLISEFREGGIAHLFLQPHLVLEQKYKNLRAQESLQPKIPYILHHIWLTSPESPREVRTQDLLNAVMIHMKLSSSPDPWTHIVWSNDPALIPESVKALKTAGIEVRSIADHPDLTLFYLVNKFIQTKEWGKASDTLRYAVLEKFGGIYADINYKITRLLNSEAHKYNFFTSTWGGYYIENYFMGASPNHPVIKRMLHLVERNMVSPPPYIAKLHQNSRKVTDLGTANPTFLAYYLEANKNGNVDVVYPFSRRPPSLRFDDDFYRYEHPSGESKEQVFALFKKHCVRASLFNDFVEFVNKNEICGSSEFYYGEDSEDGLTWLSDQSG